MQTFYLPKSIGRNYTRNKQGRVKPLSDTERLAGLYRRYDTLCEELAEAQRHENTALIETVSAQIACQQVAIDNQTARMEGQRQ